MTIGLIGLAARPCRTIATGRVPRAVNAVYSAVGGAVVAPAATVRSLRAEVQPWILSIAAS